MPITIQMVLDELLSKAARPEQTVDALSYGGPEQEVTGVMVCFMPTQKVIEEAVLRKANLIIAHEGLYFAHHNPAEEEEDSVSAAKRKRLQESGIAFFRNHDTLHRYQVDGVMAGLVEKLGWGAYAVRHLPASSLFELPPTTVSALAAEVKEKLGLPYIRLMGDPEMSCRKVGLLVGYRGGRNHTIPLYEQDDADVILYGEGPEWETPEYVRDSITQGKQRALLVMGHAESEEPGMELLARQLQERFRDLPVFYMKERPLFQIV